MSEKFQVGLDEDTDVAVQYERPACVILFNDEDHTYQYVVEVLTKICKLNKNQAFKCAVEADLRGRTVVFRGSKEESNKVCEQIKNYGPDHRLLHSMSSMNAEVSTGGAYE